MLLASFTVIAINVARTCGTHATLKAFISSVTQDVKNWAAVFISETDASTANLDFEEDAHVQYRHMPGRGCRPMRWVVNAKYKSSLKGCKWLGRAGALTLGNMCIVGTHNGFGATLTSSLLDAAKLVKKRPWGTCPIVLGDFNIDLLPVQHNDPWGQEADRPLRHREERCLLYS